MKIVWDATGETMYPVAHANRGLTSGSVKMIHYITTGLAQRGHTIHVVANDVDSEVQVADNLWYWPKNYHPTGGNVVVMTHQLSFDFDYSYDKLVLAHTGCVPDLGSGGRWAAQIDCWPVFSETHKKLLLDNNPTVDPDHVFITGLGVDLTEYNPPWSMKVPGRMLYANDPQRCLWSVLDIFDLVKKDMRDASLHVAYDFDRQLEFHKWHHSQMAELLIECQQRIRSTPGVFSLGAISDDDIVREQLECYVHTYPSDPPGIGTQTHGLTQMELAAASTPLVLSNVEAFPEVFGEAATILPVIGKYRPDIERRIEASDYAIMTLELMTDKDKWSEASQKSRALAEKNTWDKVIDAWEGMLNARKQS